MTPGLCILLCPAGHQLCIINYEAAPGYGMTSFFVETCFLCPLLSSWFPAKPLEHVAPHIFHCDRSQAGWSVFPYCQVVHPSDHMQGMLLVLLGAEPAFDTANCF